MLQLLGVVAIVMGAIAFLAIPVHSAPAQWNPPQGEGVFQVGGYWMGGGRCGVFESGGVCGSSFWLRVGVFLVGLVIGIILLAKADSLGPAPLTGFFSRLITPGVPLFESGGVMRTVRPPDASVRTVEVREPSPPPPPPSAESKTCPDCAEVVRYAARKCRFCGYQFSDWIGAATSVAEERSRRGGRASSRSRGLCTPS